MDGQGQSWLKIRDVRTKLSQEGKRFDEGLEGQYVSVTLRGWGWWGLLGGGGKKVEVHPLSSSFPDRGVSVTEGMLPTPSQTSPNYCQEKC